MKYPFVFFLFFFIVMIMVLLLRSQQETKQQKPQVHIVIIATDPNRADQVLASIARKKGYVVHMRGLGEPWTGYEVKLRHTLAQAKQLKPDDVLIHLDAFDTYVLADAEEVLRKFKKMDANIVVSTEVNLAPNHEFENIRPLMDYMYPTAPNRFRWINSGTYMGYAGAIVNLLSMEAPNFHCDMPTGDKTNYSDDQRCFHTLFLRHGKSYNIKLDYNQDIFHCMWGVEQHSIEPQRRLHSETGSNPCILHGNGQSGSFAEVVGKIKSKND